MPITLRIENDDASTNIDLDGTDIKILAGSWITSPPVDGLVTETMIIQVGTSAANIRSQIQTLEGLLEQARDWHQVAINIDPVWMRWNTDGETAKRALIYDYSLTPADMYEINPALPGNTGRFDLVLTRHMAWEHTSTTTTSVNDLSALGGVWNLRATTGGRIDSRISRLTVETSISATYSKLWLGFRPEHRLDSGQTYEALEEAESMSTASGSTSNTNVEATASPGSGTSEIEFTLTSTMAEMGWVLLSGFNSTPSSVDWDYIGRHLVLARMRVDASTEIGVRMSTTWINDDLTATTARQTQSTRYIDNTEWRMIEMGEIDVPGPNWRGQLESLATQLQRYSLHFEGVLTSGTGHLYIDCFILVPAEHLIVWDAGDINMETDDQQGEIFTDANGFVNAYVWDNAGAGARDIF